MKRFHLRSRHIQRHGMQVVSASLVIILALFLTSTLTAQTPLPNPNVCYAIADQVDASSTDTLMVMDRLPPFTPPHTGSVVGLTGTINVETAALSIDSTFLYATNDNSGATPDDLGRIDIATGVWTTIGPLTTATNPFLPVGSPGTAVAMDDVDSLDTDPMTGELWAITHDFPPNIFRISKSTGAVIPDTFGPGIDYAQVDFSGLTNRDADDLGIDPVTGEFFVIANGGGIFDELVRLNIDGANPAASPGLSNGVLSITVIGPLTNAADGSFINDMEGFAFFNDGAFYGTTGDQSNPSTNDDSLWSIDQTTAIATLIGTYDDPTDAVTHHDFEGLGCLTAGPNTMSGIVFCEPVSGFDGVFNAGDTVQPGATINLYLDADNNGLVGAGDRLLQTQTTDGSGNFSFQVGRAGNFVIEMDGAIVPAGSLLTTDPPIPTSPVEEADFVNQGTQFSEFNQTDSDNRFGFTCTETRDVAIVKQASAATVGLGDTFTYSLQATNNGPDSADNVVVTDTIPAQVSYVSNDSGCSIAASTLTCNLGTMASGASTTIQVTVTAQTVGTANNTATITTSDQDYNPNNNTSTATVNIIDTTPTATPGQPPTNPPGTTGTPGTPGTPGTITSSVTSQQGLVLSKMGFRQGSGQVEWVVTVNNSGTQTGAQVVITDEIPSGLVVRRVDVTDGTATTTNNVVTVTFPTLAPGSTVMFSIFTSAPATGTLENSACMTAQGQTSPLCVTARTVQALPSTGETPVWRTPLIAAILGIFTLFGFGLISYHRAQ